MRETRIVLAGSLLLLPQAASARPAPLLLHLRVLPASSTPRVTTFELTLRNQGRASCLVQETAAPDRGFYPEFTDPAGRPLSMRKGSMPEVPRVQRAEFVSLAPGRSRTFRFRWDDHFQYRGRGRVRRTLRVRYVTGGRDGKGRPVPEVSVWSNLVPLLVSPEGALIARDRGQKRASARP
jgi:hypothetical protein